MSTVTAAELLPGDRFRYAGTPVTALRVGSTTDPFGREMVRVWATRHDTGAEGWLLFGQNAILEVKR